MCIGWPVELSLLCLSLFHTGPSGREEALHMMSSMLIMRLNVIVKAPEEGLPGEKKKKDTWGYHMDIF